MFTARLLVTEFFINTGSCGPRQRPLPRCFILFEYASRTDISGSFFMRVNHFADSLPARLNGSTARPVAVGGRVSPGGFLHLLLEARVDRAALFEKHDQRVCRHLTSIRKFLPKLQLDVRFALLGSENFLAQICHSLRMTMDDTPERSI